MLIYLIALDKIKEALSKTIKILNGDAKIEFNLKNISCLNFD